MQQSNLLPDTGTLLDAETQKEIEMQIIEVLINSSGHIGHFRDACVALLSLS